MARVTDNYLELKFLAIGDSGVGKVIDFLIFYFWFDFALIHRHVC
jgi:hypothetical protein